MEALIKKYSRSAQGTVLTDSTTETELDGYTLPGGSLAAGKDVVIKGAIRVLDNNSTDELTVKVKFGGTTIYTSGAVNSEDNDMSGYKLELQGRGLSSSESIPYKLTVCEPDAAGQAAKIYHGVIAGLDTTGSLAFSVTGTWSVAHADNQVAAEMFSVWEA